MLAILGPFQPRFQPIFGFRSCGQVGVEVRIRVRVRVAVMVWVKVRVSMSMRVSIRVMGDGLDACHIPFSL